MPHTTAEESARGLLHVSSQSWFPVYNVHVHRHLIEYRICGLCQFLSAQRQIYRVGRNGFATLPCTSDSYPNS